MRRRNFLPALATASAAAAPRTGDWSNAFAKSWRDAFRKHWTDTREYTLEVLDAMPEAHFESKPNPAQRSFSEQMLHLAYVNMVYFRAFDLVKPPEILKTETWTVPQEEARLKKAFPTKAALRQYVVATFDYGDAVIDKIAEKDLMRTDLVLWPKSKKHTGSDVFFRAYMHTAHHRGQLVVYLRVQNIVPPKWKFEATA